MIHRTSKKGRNDNMACSGGKIYIVFRKHSHATFTYDLQDKQKGKK
jgi:hypothetical protein